MATAARAEPIDREALAGPALRTFFAIAGAWRLSEQQQMRLLGLDSRSTLHAWKSGKVRSLSRDAVERISYVLGIYKALQLLLPEAGVADAWVKRPNAAPPFGGRAAIDRMASGNVADLFVVRQYLDAQRGWS
ncbi:MAG: hypothetical protein JWO25_1305 [Alphaproteobacteria bacterium]|nr:hypothetical protein [Alphaproteobacteria bacterium]